MLTLTVTTVWAPMPIIPTPARRGGKLAPLETTVKALSEEQMSAAKFQFDAYDSDSSGTISAAELRNLLQALDLTFTDDVFEAYARTTFREADRDLSGALDWNEFLKVYSSIIYESRKSVRLALRVRRCVGACVRVGMCEALDSSHLLWSPCLPLCVPLCLLDLSRAGLLLRRLEKIQDVVSRAATTRCAHQGRPTRAYNIHSDAAA